LFTCNNIYLAHNRKPGGQGGRREKILRIFG
jgi:hypothetical protein